MLKSLLLCLLFLCTEALAQHPDDEYYYPYAEREAPVERIRTDSALFYRAVQTAADLHDAAAFDLPQVALKRRGRDYWAETATLGGVAVNYRYFASLRALGCEQNAVPGIATAPGTVGGAGGVRRFFFDDGVPQRPYAASVRLADRNYRVGARLTAQREFKHGWRGAAAVDVRTGRDLHVEGVFTNAATVGLRGAKRLGEQREFSVLLVAPLSMRGMRVASSEETFSLTGDKLYNPAWGFQGGKVRNSRVRREAVPLAVAELNYRLSAATSLSATASGEVGVRKYSSLGWYNARTPMPDNYRYLPSYTLDRETDVAWRADDARYTQIDWDGLIAQNRMAGGEAVYALEDRVERLCNLRFAATATTDIDSRLTLRYGLFGHRLQSRNYKQMRDLLGADHLTDIDQYLIDDDAYGNLLQNDLRHPDRTIGRGDRFGYDYSLCESRVGAGVQAEYRADRLRVDVAAELCAATVSRYGHYEKELFPGAQSLGRSRRLHFTPYAFKASAGWAFSPRSFLQLSAMAAAQLPEVADLFYQPLYNNRTVENPLPERTYAAELNYRRTGEVVDWQFAAFLTTLFDGMQTLRYFDDRAGLYCDMAATGIGRFSGGVEAAADIRLSYRWRLSLAATAGRYKFLRNPIVTVLSDADNTAVDTRAVSHMGGCTEGGAPQLTATGSIRYFGAKGWGFRLSTGYAASRYVEPAFLRRTERIARQNGVTSEDFDRFVGQEQLADAFTLDAWGYKSFYWGGSQLTVALSVRNLLGGQVAYNGYESLRTRHSYAGDGEVWQPHASRYTYVYPRSFYLTIVYRF